MDKLELDARVARLERAVTLLWTVVAAGALLMAGLLLFSLASLRARPYAAGSAVAVRMPTPVAPPVPLAAPVTVATTVTPTVTDLAGELSTLQDLYGRSIISGSERDAKKAKLVDGPLVVGDMKTDLEQVHELYGKGVINGTERDKLKSKVLGLGQ